MCMLEKKVQRVQKRGGEGAGGKVLCNLASAYPSVHAQLNTNSGSLS